MRRTLIYIAHLFDGFEYKQELPYWKDWYDYRSEFISIQKCLGWQFSGELDLNLPSGKISVMYTKRKFTKARKMCRFLNKKIDKHFVAFILLLWTYSVIISLAICNQNK